MIESQAFKIERHNFDISNIESLDNHFANNLWPIVYLLSDEIIKEAYVGETTDAKQRLRTHLKNNKKNRLTTFRLISSEKFNKSYTTAKVEVEKMESRLNNNSKLIKIENLLDDFNGLNGLGLIAKALGKEGDL